VRQRLEKIKLIPFAGRAYPDILVESVMHKKEGTSKLSFMLEYHLEGDLTCIFLPKLKRNPKLKDRLWEHTCFEAFLAWGDHPSYWEVNLSPSGDWNTIYFERYRVQKKVDAVSSVEFQVLKNSKTQFQCLAEVDIPLTLEENVSHSLDSSPLWVSLTAVIEEKNQTLSYWANHHEGNDPDFHLRKSFNLLL